jgi:Flp pilus assembly protein TadD
MRQVSAIVVLALSLATLTSAQQTAYEQIACSSMRSQAIINNDQYTDMVATTLSELANTTGDKDVANDFAGFYKNPTTDDYHFQPALEMVNIAKTNDTSGLAAYIKTMYAMSHLGSAIEYSVGKEICAEQFEAQFAGIADPTEREIRRNFALKGIVCGDEFEKLVATAKKAEATSSSISVAEGY